MKIEKGYKAFITGAASGIGRAAALAVARRGCRLFLTDINQEGLSETCRLVESEGGEVCRSQAFDISSLEQVKTFADEVHTDFGPMDVVMNVAGIALFAFVEDMTHDHWQKLIDTNLWGPIHVVECFLPEMISAKNGHLVNVSSSAGILAGTTNAGYCTTKWGLLGLSEVLHYELMPHNIGVSVVCPLMVNTPLVDTVELVGVNQDSEPIKEIKDRFRKSGVPPERLADMMISAIEKNQFMVLTSLDIKILYFLKRHLFPLYDLAMKRVSRDMHKIPRMKREKS
jgi:NAD(P)-dependent dehydrogenase (short-subunit alcohol dehydrogenase family)